MPDLYATLDDFAGAGPGGDGVHTSRTQASESVIFNQLMLDLASFCNAVEKAGASQEIDTGVAHLNAVYSGEYRHLRFIYGYAKNGNEIRKDVVEQIKKQIEDASYISEKFTVSNEEYEIYTISVRDNNGGEAKCSATLTLNQEIVERDDETSNGASAVCSVSTLVN